jgi:hypothetical protein
MLPPPDGQEPLSPELILVAPADEARAAREHLEDAPGSEWDEFLTRVRAQPEPAPDVETTAKKAEPPKRRSRRPLVAAGLAILLVSLAVGIAWARDRGPKRAAQPPATVATSPADARTTPVRPAPRKKRTPKPTLVAPKRTHSTGGVKPARATKSKARAKRRAAPKRGAGFVPARIWSWPEGPSSPHYLVRFFRNGHKVLAVRTARPRLVLPKRFTFRAGRYRWIVVPISASGKPGRALVDSTFVVSKARR